MVLHNCTHAKVLMLVTFCMHNLTFLNFEPVKSKDNTVLCKDNKTHRATTCGYIFDYIVATNARLRFAFTYSNFKLIYLLHNILLAEITRKELKLLWIVGKSAVVFPTQHYTWTMVTKSKFFLVTVFKISISCSVVVKLLVTSSKPISSVFLENLISLLFHYRPPYQYIKWLFS